MQLAAIGAVAVIAVVALVAMALRRARYEPPSPIADPYDELYSKLRGEIVARSMGEHGEVGAGSDPLGSTEAGAGVAPDRLLEPPEWPDDFSTRLAELTRVR